MAEKKKVLSKDERQKLEVSMIAAVTQALTYKRYYPEANNDKAIDHVVKYASVTKNQIAQFAMIAAASKALGMLERNSKLKEKDVLVKMMGELPKIIDDVLADASVELKKPKR